MPTMQEAYTRNVGDMDPETMDTLFLDNSTTRGRVFGLAAKYTNLAMLSLVNCNLTTLVGLPYMPSLSYLDISQNQLGEQAFFESLIQKTPVVEKISMSGNQLAFAHLRALRNLPKLSELDLANNAHLGTNYRDRVFQLIPSLKILDGCDIDGEEVDERDDEDDDDDDLDDDLEGLGHHHHHIQQAPPPRGPAAAREAHQAPAHPVIAHRGVIHQVHVGGGRPPPMVPPHRVIAAARRAQAQGARAEPIYQEEEEHHEHNEEEEEYVDVDGLEEGVEEGSADSGGGEMEAYLDDSAFTYNEEAYYDPEDSISATIDDVIASTSGHLHHPHHQHHRQGLLNPPATSSPRGIKRVAPTAQPPAPTAMAPTTGSSSGEEVDVEGLEPETKKVALLEEPQRGGSDDDLNVE